jgi:hypothetical protein
VFQEYLFNRLDRELEVLSSLTLADVLLYIRHQFIPLTKHPLIQEFMRYNILYLKVSYYNWCIRPLAAGEGRRKLRNGGHIL